MDATRMESIGYGTLMTDENGCDGEKLTCDDWATGGWHD